MAQATARRWSRMDGVFAAVLERPFARRLVRDSRYTIPICIILICIAINFIGDALRDAFETRLQRR